MYTRSCISDSSNFVVIMIDRYKKRFYKFDKESKGFITTVDVQQVLEVSFIISFSYSLLQVKLNFLNILDCKNILLLFVLSSHYFVFKIYIFSLESIMLVKIS